MGRVITGTIVACILLFASAALLEWRYYANDERHASQWAVASAVKGSATSTKKNTSGAKEQVVPRKLKTNLAALVEKEAAGTRDTGLTGSGDTPEWLATSLPDPAVIVFCYNRPKYLAETLQSLAALPWLDHFTVYISQDGDDPGVSSLAAQAVNGSLRPPVTRAAEHWVHPREPLLTADQPGHAWLTQHYKWGLSRVLDSRGHSHAVVLEDDMVFSADLLAYFAAAAPLLERDPTLWCISSWNDNGQASLDWRNDRLFRTSYFPGLGWMLRRELWLELGPRFPLQAWDHWMRLDSVSKGRECVCPEVNRNRNIGQRGANMHTSVFKRYLAKMSWSTETVASWGELDYLLLPAYRARMEAIVASAQLWEGPITATTLAAAGAGKVWLVPYKGENYLKLARVFRIWPFPRGHHQHLALLPYKGSTFALADQRFCPLLPDQLRVFPDVTLQAAAGAVGQDCDAVCRDRGAACRAEDFWFINTCEALAQHFPCERGCAVELGADVPNYVVGAGLPTHHTCLVTQAAARCSASHNATRRLCPCVTAPQA